MSRPPSWGDFKRAPILADEATAAADTAATFAVVFTGGCGPDVLGYLRSITKERALSPAATDAELRHLEGQRHLVAHIELLIERGLEQMKKPKTPA